MKHVFEIKDFIASKESAEHIIESQVNVILKSADDLDIIGINIFINDTEAKYYKEISSTIPIKFIPTLRKGKKTKSAEKQTFTAFHNFIINAITPILNSEDLIIHIQDGTLDLTDSDSEFKKQKTRLGEMITDVIYMMQLLDHPVWFNTASDKGNIKFGHYYTMIDLINIDNDYQIECFPECIMYSGNSNLDWIMIDAKNYKNQKLPSLMMHNDYDYDFLAIKHLIAKFVDFDKGYFDSMFPTVPTEVGAYNRNPKFDKDLLKLDMSKYKDNIEKYKLNIKEFDKFKPTTINDVVEYVRKTVGKKLPESDKKKLETFVNSVQQGI